MNTVCKKKASINILPPICSGEKLLFRVFDNATSIGYARLKKVNAGRLKSTNIVDMYDPFGFAAYELKMIEISQNYRHQGVGTSLLKEIIRYCQDSGINLLTGDIKGEALLLRSWYRNNGFSVSNDDRIELLPKATC